MHPALPESSLDMARRHVAEAETRCTRQRELLRRIDADKHPAAAKIAQQLLTTMETTLSVMLDHLRFEEQW
jgi:hypothetical protein